MQSEKYARARRFDNVYVAGSDNLPLGKHRIRSTFAYIPHTYVPHTTLNNLPCTAYLQKVLLQCQLIRTFVSFSHFYMLNMSHIFLCQVLFRDIHSHSISRSPVVKIDDLNALTLGKLICQESSQIQPPVPTHPKSKD